MKKLTINEITTKCNKIHENKYTYDFSEYINSKSKISIYCPIHGKFNQFLYDHLNGRGCPRCAIEKNAAKKRNSIYDLISKAKILYGNIYNYSLIINYKSMVDIQNIICEKHGIFKMSLHEHINKNKKCYKCAIEDRTDTLDDFIAKANLIHNYKYNYDNVIYIKSKIKVEIICEKHGVFLQKPMDHINNKQGCPICNTSKGEMLISSILEKYNIKYIPQKKFKGLKYKKSLIFDFYLPQYNCCIEFDGEQHFRPIEYWGGEKTFEDIKNRDIIKNEYCKLNNIRLIRFSYKDNHDIIELNIKSNLNII
jgi:hypothetical protein